VRILIVEDDRDLAITLGDLMGEQHAQADLAFDGVTGLDNALTGIYDLIIIDVMLPGMSGYQVVQELRRADSLVPVLMLTARSSTEDKVIGLDSGADYYLTKPFQSDELLACIRALARRREGRPDAEAISYGDLKLDLAGGTLACRERTVRLSQKEFALMRLLMLNAKNVVTKETLLLKVWGYETEAEENSVEVYVSFLRKKLNHLQSKVAIKAIRRMGYHLEVET
jgi:DNA-binding response OmpR family regulator